MDCYISCRLAFKIIFSKANFFDRDLPLHFYSPLWMDGRFVLMFSLF